VVKENGNSTEFQSSGSVDEANARILSKNDFTVQYAFIYSSECNTTCTTANQQEVETP